MFLRPILFAIVFAISILTLSCDNERKPTEFVPVEEFIGESKDFAHKVYEGADVTRNEYRSEEELHIIKWSYEPQREDIDPNVEPISPIEFFAREEEGYIVFSEREFNVEDKDAIKNIYQLKIANYVDKYGDPKCDLGGEPMDMDKIDNLYYLTDCTPLWRIGMSEGVSMVIEIRNHPSNLSRSISDEPKDIEKVEVNARVETHKVDDYLETMDN